MSRFSSVPLPPMSPAQCKVCGSATKGPFVDLHTTEDYYGSLYYCYECAGEIASIVGFKHPKDYAALEQQIADLTLEVAKANKVADRALTVQGILNDLVKRYDEHVLSTFSGDSNSPVEISYAANPVVDDGKNVVNEPSNESGLADVFSSGNFDKPLKAGKRTTMVDI